MDLRDRTASDPAVCGGEPVIRGTQVTLRTLLASLDDGDGVEQNRAASPSLVREDVIAAIAFAASSAREDLPVSPPRPVTGDVHQDSSTLPKARP
jgi:uncharacterized protein (DUF433 family)